MPNAPVDGPSPPERKKLGSSPGGVDMRSGSLNFQNVDVSIGGDGDAGLSLLRSFSYKNSDNKFRQAFGNFLNHNWDIQIQERRLPRAGACYPNQFDYSETVVYGELGGNFRKTSTEASFHQVAPFGYAELTASTTNGNNPNNFVFTARDGTVVIFGLATAQVCSGAIGRCAYASSVKRPDGTLYTLDYDTLSDGSGKRLRSFVSSRDFALLFGYGDNAGGFLQTVKVCALNLAITPKPANNVCPSDAVSASYTYSGSVQMTATDAAGGQWNFAQPSLNMFTLRRPGESQPYVTNSFSFVRGSNDEEPSFVIDSQQLATGQSYSYTWSILYNEDGQGGRSEQVLGGQWSDGQVIMDVEASTAVRQAEVTACKRMIARVQDRFGVWPERLAADTAYGSAKMLAWLVPKAPETLPATLTPSTPASPPAASERRSRCCSRISSAS